MTGIPHMCDDDGALAEQIAALAPRRDADETPRGRLAGIERDEWLTYREMYELLTGQVAAISPEANERALQDLAVRLGDLHRRGEDTFQEIEEAQWDARPREQWSEPA